MYIGRLIAYISLILALLVVGAEGLRILQGQSDQWITFSQTIDFAISNGSQRQVGNMESGWLDVPAVIVYFALSTVLFLLTARNKRRK